MPYTNFTTSVNKIEPDDTIDAFRAAIESANVSQMPNIPPMPSPEDIRKALDNQSARGIMNPKIQYGPSVFESWGPTTKTMERLSHHGVVVYRRPLGHRGHDDHREPYRVGLAEDCDSFLLSLRYGNKMMGRTAELDQLMSRIYKRLYGIFAEANPIFEIPPTYINEGYDFRLLFHSVIYLPHVKDLRTKGQQPNSTYMDVNFPLIISRREKEVAASATKNNPLPSILTPCLVVPAPVGSVDLGKAHSVDSLELLAAVFYANTSPSVMCIPLPYYMGVASVLPDDINLREDDIANWAERNKYSAYVIQRHIPGKISPDLYILAVQAAYTDLTNLVEMYLPDLLIPATVIEYPKASFLDLLDQMLSNETSPS